MAEVDVHLRVEYLTTGNLWKVTTWFSNSSNPANSSGFCSWKEQRLDLSWNRGPSGEPWTLQLLFVNSTTSHFSLEFINFTFSINNDSFPDAKNNGSYSFTKNASIFTCPFNSYFQCLSPQTYGLDGSDPSGLKVELTTSNMKMQAYRNDPSPDFVGEMVECAADFKPNQVVPIIVGIALALMIVIAIVTFLVATRRRRGRYQEI